MRCPTSPVSAWYARLCLSFKIHVVYSVCRIGVGTGLRCRGNWWRHRSRDQYIFAVRPRILRMRAGRDREQRIAPVRRTPR